MNYLEGKKAGGDKDFAWLELFDLVLVGGNKPAFLLEQSLPVYAVDPLDGSLSNLDAGPMSLETHRVLQGGDHRMLLRLLGLTAGDRLLYVGDHVYSDVLRSKRSLGWRTCLIVPELQQEIVSHGRLMRDRQTLLSLRRQQVQLESLLDELELQLLQRQLQLQRNRDTPTDTSLVATEEAEALQTLIGMRRVELGQLTAKLSSRLASFDAQFDSQWGQLLRSGWQESRLASQIRDNACIFTSRASNLGQMSPYRPLRPSELDVAPHDLHLLYNGVVDYDATFQPHIIID
jgi:5'-nucleotidase